MGSNPLRGTSSTAVIKPSSLPTLLWSPCPMCSLHWLNKQSAEAVQWRSPQLSRIASMVESNRLLVLKLNSNSALLTNNSPRFLPPSDFTSGRLNAKSSDLNCRWSLEWGEFSFGFGLLFVMSGFGSRQETGGSGLWFEVWKGDVTVHGVRDCQKLKLKGATWIIISVAICILCFSSRGTH